MRPSDSPKLSPPWISAFVCVVTSTPTDFHGYLSLCRSWAVIRVIFGIKSRQQTNLERICSLRFVLEVHQLDTRITPQRHRKLQADRFVTLVQSDALTGGISYSSGSRMMIWPLSDEPRRSAHGGWQEEASSASRRAQKTNFQGESRKNFMLAANTKYENFSLLILLMKKAREVGSSDDITFLK